MGENAIRYWKPFRIVALAAVLLALSFSVQAQQLDKPPMAPIDNITVTYEIRGDSENGNPTKVKITFSDRASRVRVDTFGYPQAVSPFMTVIYDGQTNQYFALAYARQKYAVRDASAIANPGLLLNPDMRYVRKGTDRVAGKICTDWDVFKDAEPRGTACVTDNGVVLRVTRLAPGAAMIVATEYKAIIAGNSMFLPPADLHLVKQKPRG
jgi:hypothetical protein